MSVIGFHGDPCYRGACPGPVRQRATHHGLCARCWLGATEAQRRDALLDEAMTADDPLEVLYLAPAREPDRERRAA